MARSVERVDAAVARTEADGLEVRRALPRDGVPHVNPFLLVEEIGPVNLAADVSTAQRPARGFEEITWVLAGTVDHIRRERGADVTTAIGPNNAEWLSTGRGDVYRERFVTGAGVRTIRIWISQPRKERQAEPAFVVAAPGTDTLQMWTTAGAPSGDLRVDLLTGRLLGARARIQPRTRVTVARLQIPADTTFIHAIETLEPGLEPPTVLLYGLAGQAMVGPAVAPVGGRAEQLVRAQELAVLTPPPGRGPLTINADEVRIRTRPAETFDVLWLCGFPVGTRADEPFVRRGSIVMRTEEEVLQTIEDFRTGRMGSLI